ncbi:chloride channel protein CLC-e [Rutidosis leptorrhynchoides]|uniref:chloride channel protein CLC-e n=1 Tax=Rutidosis leptorrhynchoides TaxID=125765 RepID=UPI003A990535
MVEDIKSIKWKCQGHAWRGYSFRFNQSNRPGEKKLAVSAQSKTLAFGRLSSHHIPTNHGRNGKAKEGVLSIQALTIMVEAALLLFHHFPSSPLLASNHYLPFSNSTTTSYLTKFKSSTSLTLFRRPFLTTTSRALPPTKQNPEQNEEEEEEGRTEDVRGNSSIIVSSCLVGLLTGIGVVLFNNSVHEIRDFFWDGIPYRGASWLREEPIEAIWARVILVPTFGGLIVGLLNFLREEDVEFPIPNPLQQQVKAVLRPFLKAVAACVTLGTGNSLGPEGPSVEIGASIGKGISALFDNNTSNRKISLLASGSAAGISSGFNAAVAGCFFAVESVLWPSPANNEDSSVSLTNTTSMVILSAVIASVISQVGLGSEPAFKVPEYDFRSPGELPLYMLLGIICGMVSLTLSKCTTYMLETFDILRKTVRLPQAVFPALGGLATGIIALSYPEILYWGFQNVDILLESRPFVKGLSADLLLQLVAVKIAATSLCRASGLVGGYYAPSLFIGAATGMAYGKFISIAVTQASPTFHLSILEVASPQAYGLVGMAATLAGVCQVPLTAVLLLFELTQDYRIVLPLLGAVGFSSWITSGQTRRRNDRGPRELQVQKAQRTRPEPNEQFSSSEREIFENDLCELESSLCVDDSNITNSEYKKKILVSEAMRIRFVSVNMDTALTEAINSMLTEKQSCAIVVDKDDIFVGFLTLQDIQQFSNDAKERSIRSKDHLVSVMCLQDCGKCQVQWVATPGLDLLSAEIMMNRLKANQVPVVLEHDNKRHRGHPIGILDRECISLTSSAEKNKQMKNCSTICRKDTTRVVTNPSRRVFVLEMNHYNVTSILETKRSKGGKNKKKAGGPIAPGSSRKSSEKIFKDLVPTRQRNEDGNGLRPKIFLKVIEKG